jgi:2-isopropylmalate synthase
VQKNKAVVGANAFAHESGIHQHGVLADRLTYEIMASEDVGADGSQIVLGKHSGRHAFFKAVEDLGFELDEAEAQHAFRRFKELADRKGIVSSEDVEAIVISETHVKAADDYELISLEVSGGTVAPPTAAGRDPARRTPRWRPRRVRRRVRSVTATATGDGMVDAACGAIRHAVGRDEVAWSRSRCRRSPGGSMPSGRSPSPSRWRTGSASPGAASPPTSSRRAHAPTSTR